MSSMIPYHRKKSSEKKYGIVGSFLKNTLKSIQKSNRNRQIEEYKQKQQERENRRAKEDSKKGPIVFLGGKRKTRKRRTFSKRK